MTSLSRYMKNHPHALNDSLTRLSAIKARIALIDMDLSLMELYTRNAAPVVQRGVKKEIRGFAKGKSKNRREDFPLVGDENKKGPEEAKAVSDGGTSCSSSVALCFSNGLTAKEKGGMVGGFSFQVAARVRNVLLCQNLLKSVNGIVQFCNVSRLSLRNNRIERIEDCEALSLLPKLQYLSLEGNPVALLPNFVFHMLRICSWPNALSEGGCRLKQLDALPITKVEVKLGIGALHQESVYFPLIAQRIQLLDVVTTARHWFSVTEAFRSAFPLARSEDPHHVVMQSCSTSFEREAGKKFADVFLYALQRKCVRLVSWDSETADVGRMNEFTECMYHRVRRYIVSHFASSPASLSLSSSFLNRERRGISEECPLEGKSLPPTFHDLHKCAVYHEVISCLEDEIVQVMHFGPPDGSSRCEKWKGNEAASMKNLVWKAWRDLLGYEAEEEEQEAREGNLSLSPCVHGEQQCGTSSTSFFHHFLPVRAVESSFCLSGASCPSFSLSSSQQLDPPAVHVKGERKVCTPVVAYERQECLPFGNPFHPQEEAPHTPTGKLHATAIHPSSYVSLPPSRVKSTHHHSRSSKDNSEEETSFLSQSPVLTHHHKNPHGSGMLEKGSIGKRLAAHPSFPSSSGSRGVSTPFALLNTSDLSAPWGISPGHASYNPSSSLSVTSSSPSTSRRYIQSPIQFQRCPPPPSRSLRGVDRITPGAPCFPVKESTLLSNNAPAKAVGSSCTPPISSTPLPSFMQDSDLGNGDFPPDLCNHPEEKKEREEVLPVEVSSMSFMDWSISSLSSGGEEDIGGGSPVSCLARLEQGAYPTPPSGCSSKTKREQQQLQHMMTSLHEFQPRVLFPPTHSPGPGFEERKITMEKEGKACEKVVPTDGRIPEARHLPAAKADEEPPVWSSWFVHNTHRDEESIQERWEREKTCLQRCLKKWQTRYTQRQGRHGPSLLLHLSPAEGMSIPSPTPPAPPADIRKVLLAAPLAAHEVKGEGEGAHHTPRSSFSSSFSGVPGAVDPVSGSPTPATAGPPTCSTVACVTSSPCRGKYQQQRKRLRNCRYGVEKKRCKFAWRWKRQRNRQAVKPNLYTSLSSCVVSPVSTSCLSHSASAAGGKTHARVNDIEKDEEETYPSRSSLRVVPPSLLKEREPSSCSPCPRRPSPVYSHRRSFAVPSGPSPLPVLSSSSTAFQKDTVHRSVSERQASWGGTLKCENRVEVLGHPYHVRTVQDTDLPKPRPEQDITGGGKRITDVVLAAEGTLPLGGHREKVMNMEVGLPNKEDKVRGKTSICLSSPHDGLHFAAPHHLQQQQGEKTRMTVAFPHHSLLLSRYADASFSSAAASPSTIRWRVGMLPTSTRTVPSPPPFGSYSASPFLLQEHPYYIPCPPPCLSSPCASLSSSCFRRPLSHYVSQCNTDRKPLSSCSHFALFSSLHGTPFWDASPLHENETSEVFFSFSPFGTGVNHPAGDHHLSTSSDVTTKKGDITPPKAEGKKRKEDSKEGGEDPCKRTLTASSGTAEDERRCTENPVMKEGHTGEPLLRRSPFPPDLLQPLVVSVSEEREHPFEKPSPAISSSLPLAFLSSREEDETGNGERREDGAIGKGRARNEMMEKKGMNYFFDEDSNQWAASKAESTSVEGVNMILAHEGEKEETEEWHRVMLVKHQRQPTSPLLPSFSVSESVRNATGEGKGERSEKVRQEFTVHHEKQDEKEAGEEKERGQDLSPSMGVRHGLECTPWEGEGSKRKKDLVQGLQEDKPTKTSSPVCLGAVSKKGKKESGISVYANSRDTNSFSYSCDSSFSSSSSSFSILAGGNSTLTDDLGMHCHCKSEIAKEARKRLTPSFRDARDDSRLSAVALLSSTPLPRKCVEAVKKRSRVGINPHFNFLHSSASPMISDISLPFLNEGKHGSLRTPSESMASPGYQHEFVTRDTDLLDPLTSSTLSEWVSTTSCTNASRRNTAHVLEKKIKEVVFLRKVIEELRREIQKKKEECC